MRRWLALGFLLAPACLLAAPVEDIAARANALTRDPQHLARQLIVTFTDRSIGRSRFDDPLTGSGYSNEYQSSSWSRWNSTDIARDYHLYKVTEWPIASLGVQCVVYEVSDNRDVATVLKAIAVDKRVQSAQAMNVFRAKNGTPYSSLQYVMKSMSIGSAHRYATGRNSTVAIIDTGVDLKHPDLQGQIVEHDNFVDGDQSFDDDVHGTAIAGVIAGSARNQGILGVAPNARVMALKACWPENPGSPAALCSSLTLARALDAALRLQPRILNMSLAGPPDPLLALLVRTALEQGLIVVAAAPATDGAGENFPALVPGVVRVRSSPAAAGTGGAVDRSVMFAPGTDILTTFPHGAYNFISGDSFAAAHVSGVIALLLEIKPSIDGSEANAILAKSVGLHSRTVAQEALDWPSVNACDAIRVIHMDTRCDAAASDSSTPVPPIANVNK